MSLANDEMPFQCVCKDFTKCLIILTREILSDVSDQKFQWEKFMNFVKQWSCCEEDVNDIRSQTSTRKFCSRILEKQDDFFNRIMEEQDDVSERKLSTLLLKLLSFMSHQPHFYFSDCFLEIYTDSPHLVELICSQSINMFGASDYTQFLVNFDLLPSLNDDDPLRFKSDTLQFIRRIGNFTGTHERNDEDYTLGLATGTFFENSIHKSYKRIYLTTIAAYAAAAAQFSSKKKISNEYISSLRYYFTATRIPLLSLNEVRIMLDLILRGHNTKSLFESIYEKFVKLMPECSANLEPRNLTDLARCEIRENLKRSNLPLPAAVEKLDLPQPLKDFVLGNVIIMSRPSGNVSQEHIIAKSQLRELSWKIGLPRIFTWPGEVFS